MKKQLSDEQLDHMIRTLMSDAMVDDTELDNIAESPSIWWGVQRNISQKTTPWPPPRKWWRVFFIGVPSMAAMVLAIVFVFLGGSVDLIPDQAKSLGSEKPSSNETRSNVDLSTPNLFSSEKRVVSPAARINKPLTSSSVKRSTLALKESRKSDEKIERSATPKDPKEPIKTDFIALSYADNPESGQIVRVKVPSSMMVTLGLVASVEKPSSLVDAEVLVGDDGLTHSIRFIRKAL
ncbi:MAG TPA: hypothetical protein PLP21_02455 [Pyrinomonadaceae bacterium]|nr:hypothetical protein [Acidobacteriota bacterium]HQZ95147.1 hypothetical protein [Pyrinomonadaceae bacterium]